MRGIMADAQEVQFFFLFLNFDMVVVIQFQENSATFGKLIEKWLEKLTRNNFLSNVFTFVAVLYRSEVSRQSLASRSSIFETRFSILETFEDRVSRLENRVSRFASRKIRNLSWGRTLLKCTVNLFSKNYLCMHWVRLVHFRGWRGKKNVTKHFCGKEERLFLPALQEPVTGSQKFKLWENLVLLQREVVTNVLLILVFDS